MSETRFETERRSQGRRLADLAWPVLFGVCGAALFLLPILRESFASSGVVVAVTLTVLVVLPPLLSLSELSTGIRGSSGAPSLIARSLGATAGVVAGAATWLLVVLECIFVIAVLGMLVVGFPASVFLELTLLVQVGATLTLLLFVTLNLAVIVMRESRVATYRPRFEAPFYPWTQVAGLALAVGLMWAVGVVAALSGALVLAVGLVVAQTLEKSGTGAPGAIYHLFARLGSRKNTRLDHELRGILGDKGLHDGDPYDELVESAITLDLRHSLDFIEVLQTGARMLARSKAIMANELASALIDELKRGLIPAKNGVAFPHHVAADLDSPAMLIMRIRIGTDVPSDNEHARLQALGNVFAAIFLICPDRMAKAHHRMLSQLTARAEQSDFLPRWLEAGGPRSLKQLLSDVMTTDSGASHDDLLAAIDWGDEEAGLGDISSEELLQSLPPSYVERADWLRPS